MMEVTVKVEEEVAFDEETGDKVVFIKQEMEPECRRLHLAEERRSGSREINREGKRKQRRQETPEEREKRLELRRNRQKMLRVEKKSRQETPEEREKRLRKLERDRQWRREKRRQETPEERKRRNEREQQRRREKRRQQTPEERKRHERELEQRREKWRQQTAEKKKKRMEQQRRRRLQKKLLQENPEEKESKLEKRREKKKAIKNQDPKAVEERRKRRRFQDMVRKASMTEEEMKEYKMKQFMYYHARRAKLGEEGLRKKYQQWRDNLTEERRKRWHESLKQSTKKNYNRYLEKMKKERPEQWEKIYEKQKEYQRKRYASETPEKKEWRRCKEKVNGARRKLRKQLEGEGKPETEIVKRLDELRIRMWVELGQPMELMPGSGRPRGRMKQTTQVKRPSATENSHQGFLSTSTLENGQIESQNEDGDVEIKNVESYTNDFDDHYDDLNSNENFDLQSFHSSPPSPEHSQSSVTEDIKVDQQPISSLPKPILSCPHCRATFDKDNELRCHVGLVHPEHCWKCPKCEEMMLSPLELSQHYNSSHTNDQVNSDQKKTESGTPSLFFCMRCPPTKTSKFKRKDELMDHVRKRHPRDFWPCKHCQLLKYSKETLQVHLGLCRYSRTNIKIRLSKKY